MSRPRKSKKGANVEDLIDEEPPTIEPYSILGIDKSATADEVKSAYRKTALKHHPDKAPADQKDEATLKFQEVAFAYAVLSDPIRRKRYDATGSTAESIDFEDFSWSEFYSEQFKDVISGDAIETFSRTYKGSDEEKDDLLAAYVKFEGDWETIYEVIMLSDPLEDEGRFRGIIDKAIEEGEVEGFAAYMNESQSQKKKRMKNAKKEREKSGVEAEELAKKLGVHDKLFGGSGGAAGSSKKGGGKKESGHDALAALIQKRQAGRGSFFDHLEAKYAQPQRSKGKKRGSEEVDDEDGLGDEAEPSEEAFQAAAARLKKGKTKVNGAEGGRKLKRAKH